jgi:hypothetical protein
VAVPRKYWLIAALVVLVALTAGGAYAAREPYAVARMATGYAAKETCSCLHVSGRALDSCIAELPQQARESVVLTTSGDSVRASILFGAVSADSVYEDGFGCRLVN